MLIAAAARAGQRSSASHSKTFRILFKLGGLGVFAAALVDSSVFPLPIPGTTDLLMLVLIAHRGNPWLLATLAVVGSVIGGFTTWSTGKKGGEAALERYVPKRHLKRISRWVEKHGTLSVGLAAVLPPPMPLAPFLLAAGALGVSRNRFLASFTTARAARYSVVAWLGVRYGRHLIRWWNHYLAAYSGIISWVIFGLFAVGIAWGVWKWKQGGKQKAASPERGPMKAEPTAQETGSVA